MQKTFRLFVSSTFSDFTEERKLLHKKVFPKIKEKCKENNLTFQPIDLRWGVTDEASNDQKTLELCLEEVQSSKLTPYPNFLIMAGDRYGTVILPYTIEQKEFETLEKLVDITKNKELLNTWYKLDKNQIPASYIFESRKGDSENNKSHDGVDYTIRANWKPVNKSLLDILQNAAKNSDLSEAKKKKYFQSATEAEVIEGIFKYLDKTPKQIELLKKDPHAENVDYENVYAYIRNIDSVDNKELKSKFIDENNHDVDEFKKEIRNSINKNNIYEEKNKLNLTNVSKNENGSLEYYYEELSDTQNNFVTEMIKFLEKSINDYVEELKKHKDEDLEKFEQERFKESKLKDFLEGSRQTALNTIDEYINLTSQDNQALVIYGPSGMGKSSLMAKAIDDAENKFIKTNTKVIYRFVGSTANLTNTPEILISILKELGINEEIGKVINPQTNKEESEKLEEFYYRIHGQFKSLDKNIIIFLDAIDQVNNEDNFLWLPYNLPLNVKFIISTLDDDNYEKDSKYLKDLKNKSNNLYQLEEFEESQAKQFIFNVLEKYNRTIQENQFDNPNNTNQMEYLLDIYKDIKTPLYLSVAVQELRHWRSYDYTDLDIEINKKRSDKEKIEFKSYAKKQNLADTQKNIIQEYINNLTEFFHHDKEFVKRIFSYLYLSEGLSESELLEVLNTDETFISKIAPDKHHVKENKELPIVIWARLHSQIKEFLKLEEKDGQETMSFFHREFNDVISKQKDIKLIHEQLIELNQKLINFSNNRWELLYQALLSKYHLNFEFKYELDFESKIFIFAEKLANDCSLILIEILQDNLSIEILDISLNKYSELAFKSNIDRTDSDNFNRINNFKTKFYFYFLSTFISNNINVFGYDEYEDSEIIKIIRYFKDTNLYQDAILVELKRNGFLEKEIKNANTYMSYDKCIDSYNNISKYYSKLNNNEKAIFYKKKALVLAKEKYDKNLYKGYELYLKTLSELSLLLIHYDDNEANKINEQVIEHILLITTHTKDYENVLYLHYRDILNNVIKFNIIIKNYEESLKLVRLDFDLSKLNKQLNDGYFFEEDDRTYFLDNYFLIYSLNILNSNNQNLVDNQNSLIKIIQSVFDELLISNDSDEIENKFRSFYYFIDEIKSWNILLFENTIISLVDYLYKYLFYNLKEFSSISDIFLVCYIELLNTIIKCLESNNSNNKLILNITNRYNKIVKIIYRYYIKERLKFIYADHPLFIKVIESLNIIDNNYFKYSDKKKNFNSNFILNSIIQKSLKEIFTSFNYESVLKYKNLYEESYSDYSQINYLVYLIRFYESLIELKHLVITDNKTNIDIKPNLLDLYEFMCIDILLNLISGFLSRYIKNRFVSNNYNYQFYIDEIFRKINIFIKKCYESSYFRIRVYGLDYEYEKSIKKYIEYLEETGDNEYEIQFSIENLLEVKELVYKKEEDSSEQKELLSGIINLQNRFLSLKLTNFHKFQELSELAIYYEKTENYDLALTKYSESLKIIKELYYENPKENAFFYSYQLIFTINIYELNKEFKKDLWIELLEVLNGILTNNKTNWKKEVDLTLSKNEIAEKCIIIDKFIDLLSQKLENGNTCLNYLLSKATFGVFEEYFYGKLIELINSTYLKENNFIYDLEKHYLEIKSDKEFSELLEMKNNVAILKMKYLDEENNNLNNNFLLFDEINYTRSYYDSLNELAYYYMSMEKNSEALDCFIEWNETISKLLEEEKEKYYDYDEYLNNLNDIGSISLRLKVFETSYKYFKEYFELLEIDKKITNIEELSWLIYPFVKYYQAFMHVNENIEPLEVYIKEKISYLKDKFGQKYNEKLEIEYEGYLTLKNSDDPFDNEKYELFVKIFYSNN